MRLPAALLLAALSLAGSAPNASHRAADHTVPNDNRTPAGSLRNGVMTLRLEARLGTWHPDGDDAPGAELPAFAEAGRAPQIPGPLVRVPAGTVVAVTLRNALADTLVVGGLHDRIGRSVPAEPMTLAPGATQAVRFRLDAPGTYYYWGTTTRRPLVLRTHEDAQLTGAIVVDPAGAAPPPDRVFVIGMWTDTVARAYTKRTRLLAVVNGRAWPNSERLAYTVGDTVRFRVINASGDLHPMHLHGFYFRVDSRGDGMVDTTYRAGMGDRVVTEGSSAGTTFAMSWAPERPGNWLFHCHIPEHFARRGPLGMPRAAPLAMHAGMNHAMDAMGGLVLGITVRPSSNAAAVAVAAPREGERRHLRLLVRRNAGGTDSLPYFGFAIQDGAVVPPRDSGLRVGPPLVLVRGQPTSITVVNTLDEPTAVHWHGIELESYYDGVAGFSGDGAHVSPVIAPRDSFEARMTPPRAGTFIYHTHVDEERQQLAGLAGPLIVLEPGTRYDPETDRAILFTSPLAFEDQRHAVLIDGSLAPAPLVLHAGITYRLRFVNMTLRRPTLRLELLRDTTLVRWRPLAKDGADLPPDQSVVGPALHLRGISIGETYDVEVTPDRPGELHLAVSVGRVPDHPRMATLPVHVVP